MVLDRMGTSSRPTADRLVVATWLLCVALATPAGAGSPAANSADLPVIKAAIVYNICKFVEWPVARPDTAAFTIGVLGESPDGPDFSVIAGKAIHGRPVRVITIRDAAELPACRVVYIGATRAEDWRELRRGVALQPVLTVSEESDVNGGGGLIELVYHESRVRFRIDKTAAETAGLHFSSQLLKVALTVNDS